MITYELAKKLKDSGFPQEYAKGSPWMDFAYDEAEELHMLHEDNDTQWWIGNNYSTIAKDYSDDILKKVQHDFVKCPTLSELIEACGDFSIIAMSKDNGKYYVEFDMDDGHGNNLDFRLDALEEVFAYYWLELNE